MVDLPESNAARSFAICSLFESEVLIWLMLHNWKHPLTEDDDFRNQLLETATAVLEEAASGPRHNVFIEGLPAADMNLIAAVWYAEHRALDDLATMPRKQREARVQWLAAVRHALPSCFCPQDHLP